MFVFFFSFFLSISSSRFLSLPHRSTLPPFVRLTSSYIVRASQFFFQLRALMISLFYPCTVSAEHSRKKISNVPTMNMSLIEMILFDKWIENFGCDVGNNWVLLRSWNVNEMTIHFYLAPNGCSKVEFGSVDNSAATLDWAILRLHFFVRIYQKYDSFFTQTLKIFRIQFDSHMGQTHQRNKLFNVQTNC